MTHTQSHDHLYETQDAGYCHRSGCERFATAVESADGVHASIGDGFCIEHTTYPQAHRSLQCDVCRAPIACSPWAEMGLGGTGRCKDCRTA